VLHDKLVPNLRSPFFEGKGNGALLQDRVAWIRRMIDTAWEQFPRHEPARRKVRELRDELDRGLAGVDLETTRKRLGGVAAAIKHAIEKAELSGPVYEDLIHLKSIYSRYQNYAQWLQQNSKT
jgi:hypothetical protein